LDLEEAELWLSKEEGLLLLLEKQQQQEEDNCGKQN
jgi:hypothetical protein